MIYSGDDKYSFPPAPESKNIGEWLTWIVAVVPAFLAIVVGWIPLVKKLVPKKYRNCKCSRKKVKTRKKIVYN